jgi:hypothetical protein
VRTSKLTSIILLSAFLIVASACSSAPAQTPPSTRVATQTPWIIYVNVTSTPEPAIVTPLPSVALVSPTRTSTRIVVRPTATKGPPTVAPVAAAPSATGAPACNYGTVTLREPNDGAMRQTKSNGIGGDTFRFIWDSPDTLQAPGDPTVGYQLSVSSKHTGFQNGATIYIANNKFLSDGKLYVMDKPAVSSLAGGDDSAVTWYVTIVKTTGSFNDSDPTIRPPGLVNCGSPSPTWTISLKTFEN